MNGDIKPAMESAKNPALVSEKLQKICAELNISDEVCKNLYNAYETFRKNYTLDGEEKQWLCCIIYNMSVDGEPTTINVTLMDLLRACNMTVLEFIKRMNKWMRMAGKSEELEKKMKEMEKKYQVSNIVFRKFHSSVLAMIKSDEELDMKEECFFNRQRLLEFFWALYLNVKCGMPDNVDGDFVLSFQLVFCCCDTLFANFMANRRDFLKQEYVEAVQAFYEENHPSCIMRFLCRQYESESKEATYVKEYKWKKRLTELMKTNAFESRGTEFSGLVHEDVFESNYRSLNKLYERRLMHGDFDERAPTLNDKSFVQVVGRETVYKESCPPLPFIPDNKKHLLAMMKGYRDALKQILSQSYQERGAALALRIMEKVAEMVSALGQAFTETERNHLTPTHMATIRVLFSKWLEDMMREETGKRDLETLEALLAQDIFLRALLGCVIEVVLFSHDLSKEFPFPRAMDLVNLAPYHFVRITELVVRCESFLTREMIQHLDHVQENVLECLAWQSNSPLWTSILDSKRPVPQCEEVFWSEQAVQVKSDDNCAAPLIYTTRTRSAIKSPLADCYFSPLRGRRTGGDHNRTPDTMRLKQSAMESTPSKTFGRGVYSGSGNVRAITGPPKRGGALGLFFRRFYFVMSSRIQSLCEHLNIKDEKFKAKVWTCFEHAITQSTDIMKDRHADQIMMCTVYVVGKISQKELMFHDIIMYYRNQRQACSEVYRQVLLEDGSRGDLINFYNNDFLKSVQMNAPKYSETCVQSLDLSPLPKKDIAASPFRKVSNSPIFIRYSDHTKGAIFNGSPLKPLSYVIDGSPAKDLRRINQAIMSSASKRQYSAPPILRRCPDNGDEDDEGEPVAKTTPVPLNNRLQHLIDDRIQLE